MKKLFGFLSLILFFSHEIALGLDGVKKMIQTISMKSDAAKFLIGGSSSIILYFFVAIIIEKRKNQRRDEKIRQLENDCNNKINSLNSAFDDLSINLEINSKNKINEFDTIVPNIKNDDNLKNLIKEISDYKQYFLIKEDELKQKVLLNHLLNFSCDDLKSVENMIDIENKSKEKDTSPNEAISNFDQVLIDLMKNNNLISEESTKKIIVPYIESDNFSLNLIVKSFLPVIRSSSSENQISSAIIKKIKNNKEECFNIIETDYQEGLQAPLKEIVLKLTN